MNKIKITIAVLTLLLSTWLSYKIFIIGISFENLYLSCFTTCPYGHFQLTAVPISYGFLIPSEETRQQIINKEFINGGCIIYDGAPTSQIICKKCGFERYKHNDTVMWRRISDDIASFEKPLEEITLNFPVINFVVDSNYPNSKQMLSQTIINDIVREEGIGYYSCSDGKCLFDSISLYCLSHNIEMDSVIYDTSNISKSIRCFSHFKDKYVAISIDNFPNKWLVNFSLEKN